MAKKATKAPSSPYILRRAEIAARESGPHLHPWNPRSGLFGVMLGDELGLKRTGVSIARLPAEKESFAYHAHRYEEEWLYILAGEGVALIDGVEHTVAAGDFVAFPTAPPVAHVLRNAGPEDLVYLMGGERRELDIVDFPEAGRVMVRGGARIETWDAKDQKPFAPAAPESKRKSKRK